MSDDFYRAFEEKHRGSRELIKTRLRAYHPFVNPLAEIYKGGNTIDLGCGRGEWLEIMAEIGLSPCGVDLDDGMLSDCLALNLPAQKEDAIAFLKSLGDESQVIVSAFHLVEHVCFDQLQSIVLESLRVLKLGGLLIMETPNPENIVVATCNFYIDPTHQKPIPPQLLSFLPEYYGFNRTKVVRLQESKELLMSQTSTLKDVFVGVSPDYAVIAQKTASIEILEFFDQAFNNEYGLELNKLAEWYDASLKSSIEKIADKTNQVENSLIKIQESIFYKVKFKINNFIRKLNIFKK